MPTLQITLTVTTLRSGQVRSEVIMSCHYPCNWSRGSKSSKWKQITSSDCLLRIELFKSWKQHTNRFNDSDRAGMPKMYKYNKNIMTFESIQPHMVKPDWLHELEFKPHQHDTASSLFVRLLFVDVLKLRLSTEAINMHLCSVLRNISWKTLHAAFAASSYICQLLNARQPVCDLNWWDSYYVVCKYFPII